MGDPHVLGVGMVRFGKLPNRRIRDLAGEAVSNALADADLTPSQVQAVWFANSGWGVHGGQDGIRGQVALRGSPLAGLPIMNVENACAGGATALHGAWLSVMSGAHDAVLAVGAEKVYQRDRLRMFATFLGGLDVEALPELIREGRRLAQAHPPPASPPTLSHRAPSPRGTRRRPTPWALPRRLLAALVVADHYHLDLTELARDAARERLASLGRPRGTGGDHSPFMDVYAVAARRHMARHGSTVQQLATIAAKNHDHGARNPLAQVRRPATVEEVLSDRPVAYPLTRAMCAPVGDGAAAVVLCSDAFARRHGLGRAVRVRGSVITSGGLQGEQAQGIAERAGDRAYAQAGIGPGDLHLAEVHDATAFGELHQAEALGLCAPGEGGPLAESGATRIGGRIPINTSGGLECRGHPIAASGLAQIHELVAQLRGECNGRQVRGARLGLAQNGGGLVGTEEAAMGIHVLEAPARYA